MCMSNKHSEFSSSSFCISLDPFSSRKNDKTDLLLDGDTFELQT